MGANRSSLLAERKSPDHPKRSRAAQILSTSLASRTFNACGASR